MRIAIIGSGISGLVAAHRLSREHAVVVYEAGSHVGGHTHTVDIAHHGKIYAVDTGFIVYNDWTYPNFIKLLDELGVASQPSRMSFSVRCEKTGLEYNGTSINALFAQRRNCLRPSFLRMVSDILKFNRRAPALLADDAADISLGDYLRCEGYSRPFIEHYIIPMGAAIWSSGPGDMLQFPARFLVRFFANHGFLSVDRRPSWRVIQGGSREYVKRLTAGFSNCIRLNTAVASVQRHAHRVSVRLKNGTVEPFDQLFMACHSDQALALLSDPSRQEREILGAISYQANHALLHTDERLMPRTPLAWAAWNYHLPSEKNGRATITYNMNILQELGAPVQFLLTLNKNADVDPTQILGSFTYAHPVYTAEAIAAQKRRHEINGSRRTYYCGAYWGFGFHEDGVNSALVSLQTFERSHSHAQPHIQRVG